MMLNKPEEIEAFRLLTLRAGLRLEVNTGMQITRGPSCYSRIKREFGFRGSKKKVLDQFESLLFYVLEIPLQSKGEK